MIFKRSSRSGAHSGDFRTNPGANQFRPNPARPLIAYFIANIVLGGIVTWLAVSYSSQLQTNFQLHPVEVVVSATPGTQTADIDAALANLHRADVHVQTPAGLVSFFPTNPWLLLAALIVGSFVCTGPFFFFYSIASWILSKFD